MGRANKSNIQFLNSLVEPARIIYMKFKLC